MKLKDGAEKVWCDDPFWYALTRGGYFKPKELLDAEDASKVLAAIEVLEDFKEIAMEDF